MDNTQQCPRCQRYYWLENNDHCPSCGPDQPKPKIGNDITKRRWEKATSSSDLKPVDSLHRLLADIEAGDVIEHVIVVFATGPREGEKHNGLGFYQSGPYPSSHSLGLLEYAKGCLISHLFEQG